MTLEKLKYYFLFIAIFLVMVNFSACNDSLNECLNGQGRTITKRQGLYDFNNIKVKDNISLTLVNGSVNELEISAGENLIPELGIDIIDNTLVLSNQSTCPMFKDPWKNIEMKISVKDIDTIFVESYGVLRSIEPFVDEVLTIRISDSPATVDMNIDCEFLRLENLSGTGNVNISGTTDLIECFHSGYGKVDLTKLVSRYSYINMQSSNDSYVRGGDVFMFAVLSSIGNVYYYNDPDKIEITTQSSGRLIKLQ